MSKRDRPIPPPGSTRTDLRLTKAPADTPRGRLHRLAAIGSRIGQEVKNTVRIDRDDMVKMRRVAQRGVDLLRLDNSLGGRFIVSVCSKLDLALDTLTAFTEVDVVALADGLTLTLVQLEVAESTIRDLQSKLRAANDELSFERRHSERLRADLASVQVQYAATLRDVPEETWEEPTRNSTLSQDMARAISEPAAK